MFGEDFVTEFKTQFPASWIDLMLSFEQQKRLAGPRSCLPLNVLLSFSFITFHQKMKVRPFGVL